ncbi:SusD/RagB family nutrient-binding outer membrane lipoprotein [Flavivirga spongiicola]|uniref:SusD/RagB family nutrient-binding outer membrane lipoprotein n=1 Tax=Flavivirga spongiicola TaxID=421621 RepID=A0ABU7XLC8_9FLAO|nr:SusD/RagB family nutrient-binding outer membrane lipoprotein [Flavivirga sp. MEBiC05379]MDO5981222.1 SusD/RagB family nutrient-binding outer membrane lipoprotein [Flavivirga sp. MEBiC05379]
MKAIKNIIALSIFVMLFALSSCTEDFEEINTNPNVFNSIDPGNQITKIQLDLVGVQFTSWANNLGICSPMVQHLGGSWWTQHGGQYRVVERPHWYALWEGSYPNEVKNIVDLVHRTKDVEEFKNTRAAARILKVYIFSKLTDLYGDIPYSEAGKGFIDKILQPKYDRQEDIYTDFFKELEEAVQSFDSSSQDVRGDLMFNGDIEKWKRFGNSLRMRLGFRISKVNPSESEKQVRAAINGGVMQSNDDTCMVTYGEFNFGTGENRGNAISQVFRATPNSEGFRLTNTLVDFMKNTQDPRLSIYGGTYLSVNSGEYGQDLTEHLKLGITYGAMWWNEWADFGDLVDGGGNYVAYVPHAQKHMQPSKYVAALNAPFFHMTYAEVELLLAEASIRNWGASDAQSHFEKGIRASMELVSQYPGAPPIEQSAIDDFVAANPLPATFPDDMRVIHEQMWVNFFLNGEEAYADFRRSGYPELVPFTSVEWYSSGTGGIIPRRHFYPEFEATNNPINYQEAVDRMGGTDDWLNRVWWDAE